MATIARMAEIAALAGDTSRAGMLQALMDGRALTATELARAAGITPQSASGHLSRMAGAGLISVEKQGRHRYHRLASPAVAQMLEGVMRIAGGNEPRRPLVGPRDAALRRARTCYDHLAGELGVAIADAMTARGFAELGEEAGLITETGARFLAAIGIDVAALEPRKSARSGAILCRPCLDWSERRPHLAGALGAALCNRSLEAGWVRRLDGTRALAITRAGRRIFREKFGAELA